MSLPRPAQIVARGGTLPSRVGSVSPIDRYVMSLTGSDRPRVLYLGTAGGDDPAWLKVFMDGFTLAGAEPSHLELTRDELPAGWIDHLLGQDVIYVPGGSTADLLEHWRRHGADQVIRQAWLAGTVLTGFSAGALCWFESGLTDSFSDELDWLEPCLGFLPGSFCPHYDSEPNRRPRYTEMIGSGHPGGLAADDGIGLHFMGLRLAHIVSESPGASAWQVERVGSQVVETAIPADLVV
ncbi:MAG: Type 1 glutamine amidotransferase-like domain-containing protein [Candidatus Dormibacteria bacterium]